MTAMFPPRFWIWLVFAASAASLAGVCGAEPARSDRWAVSLEVLQRQLPECHGSFAGCPEPLASLGGLTWLEGYVVDGEGHDVILFGRKAPGAAALFTEDFAVALRNAWYQYADRRGATIYYTAPGCSIDPDRKVFAQLQRTWQAFDPASPPETIEAQIEHWQTECRAPQAVRVLGVPPSRFARIMVEADYLMKRIVDGSLKAGPEGFLGLPDRLLMQLLPAAAASSTPQIRLSPWNRFEFFPGEVVYGVDDGIVKLELCPVRLLTETEYLSRTGSLVGTGKADPLAQALAEEFSARYQEVAVHHPIYHDLEGLFRFVAVARILRDRMGRELLAGLLGQPAVALAEISASKPGISNVTRLEHTLPTNEGQQTLLLWVPTCGGVSIDLERAGTKQGPRDLEGLRAAVLGSRADLALLAWPF